jgi:hypothetical protein
MSQIVNFTSWKREGLPGAKSDDFLASVSILAHWLPLSVDTLQQTHSLKEPKPVRLVKKLLR